MWYLAYLSVFLVSLLLCLLLTELMRWLALRWGFVDQPEPRKFHRQATPLLGGVAIFLSFVVTIIAGMFFVKWFSWLLPPEIQRFLPGIDMRMSWLVVIIGGGLALALLGLVDDKVNIRPLWKLLVQLLVVGSVVASGIRVRLFIPLPWLSCLLTVVWIVFIINAFNLLDNMDGVSAGVAFISSLMLFLVALMLQEYFIAVILAVFVGSLLGFLYFNFPPAKVFMGDCGSMFIGYLLAVIAVLGTYYKPYSPTLFPVAVPLLVLAVPIFDTLSVICIRLIRRRPLFQADKNHFSHRLVRLGMRVPVAVLFVYLVALCVGLPSVLLPILPLAGVLIVFAQAVVVMAVVAILEFYGKNK